MKQYIRLLVLLMFPVLCLAQRAEIDSVKRKLIYQKPDTTRVKLLNQLGILSYLIKPDTTYLLGQQAYKLSKELDFARGESRALAVMSVGLATMGDHLKALRLNQQAIAISEVIKDKNAISAIINNNAEIYFSQKDFVRSLAAYKQSLAIHIAANPDPAKYDSATYTIMYANIGDNFLKMQQFDSAGVYLDKSYRLASAMNFETILGSLLYSKGDVEIQRNRPALSLKYYREAVIYCIRTSSMPFLAEAYLRIARFYQNKVQIDSSTLYGQKALKASQDGQYLIGVLGASQFLSQVYEPTDASAALQYYKFAVSAKDSLFGQEKTKQLLTLTFEEQQRKQDIEAAQAVLQNHIKIYGLLILLAIFLAIGIFLARNIRQKQRANELLFRQKKEIDFQRGKAEQALIDLKTTQNQLIQKEKMASLGELTAGIAHEIQNPLNFVNNFSEVSRDLVADLLHEIENGDIAEATSIAKDLTINLQTINRHGDRASSIVKGMLAHSRTATGTRRPANLNNIAHEYLWLAYKGLKAKDETLNARLVTDFNEGLPHIEIVPEEIGRVLLNLYNNAFYSVGAKAKLTEDEYQPTIWVSTCLEDGYARLSVRDNGSGISDEVIQKVFQPFFTTKPAGHGTGLGLSISYDLITKGHNGKLIAHNGTGEGAEFLLFLPVRAS